MNRNEFLEALPISRIALKLTGAMLEICTDDIDDIHIMVSGADGDVKSLRISVSGDQLVVEQPAMQLAKSTVSTSWMQVTIRLPLNWKGRIDGRTVSGWINLRGLAGSDLALETVSGLMTAAGLEFISVSLRSVTGDVRVNGMRCEKCTLASTSGDLSAEAARVTHLTLTNITGNATLLLPAPFTSITASSVTGDLTVEAPVDICDVVLRTVSGRIRTSGLSIVESAEASLHFSTVSGCLDMSRREAEN